MIPPITQWLVIIHLIADFPMQDASWGAEKWHSPWLLFKHVLTYSLVWFTFLVVYRPEYYSEPYYYSFIAVCLFTLITFVTHYATDFMTSRIMHRMYVNQQFGSSIPNWGFFTMLGIDQTIHYLTLFKTYNFIFN